MTTLDYAKRASTANLMQTMKAVARIHGKSPMAQRLEMFHLGRGFGRITPAEYYDFGLYRDADFSSEKHRFIGLRAQTQINAKCTNWRRGAVAVADDKILFHQVMRAEDLPVPRIVAIYHRDRRFRGAEKLRDASDVERYLRSQAIYPVFGKPVGGIYSLGTMRLDTYDSANDMVTNHRGERILVPALVRELDTFTRHGYLFQSPLEPHGDVRKICGNRIACVRIVVLVMPEGPELFRALWKFPAGNEVADNFWRGNIIAAIDLASGRVTRAIAGVGLQQRAMDVHPDTGEAIAGASVPNWQQAKDLCVAVAPLLPGLRIQAWDVAVCPGGPVLMEVNIGGDYNLPQLATGKGMLDDQFRRLIDSVGYRPGPGPSRVARAALETLRRTCPHWSHGSDSVAGLERLQ